MLGRGSRPVWRTTYQRNRFNNLHNIETEVESMTKLADCSVAAEPRHGHVLCTFTTWLSLKWIRQQPTIGPRNCLPVVRRNLRYDRLLCPVRSHHNRLSPRVLRVYKSSTMVPSNIHHHPLSEDVFYSLSLADAAAILLPTFIHSLLRCSPSLSPRPFSSSSL